MEPNMGLSLLTASLWVSGGSTTAADLRMDISEGQDFVLDAWESKPGIED
jgi:hypothetical protein